MINVQSYVICRLMIAFVWVYHGLVPKLLGPHTDELAMNMALGLNLEQAKQLAFLGGSAEIAFGVAVLVFWKHRWPLVLTALSMVGLLAFALTVHPLLAVAAFNPVTTNLTVLALAVVGYRLQSS